MSSPPNPLSSTNIILPFGSTTSLLYHLPTNPSPTTPTVLILPFWGGSAKTFTSLLTRLATESPSTIAVAVSYPGTDFSSPHALDDNLPQLHSVANLTRNLITALNESEEIRDLIPSGKLMICAHSMSAKIAYGVLKGIPSPFQVTALLLLAPAPVGPLILPEEIRQQQLTAYDTLEAARWTMQNVLTHKPLPEEVVMDLAKDAVGMCEGAKRGWIEIGMAENCTSILREPSTALVRRKGRMPMVVVMVGREDKVETVERVQKETVEVLAGLGWDVGLKIIEGVGHLLPVEAVDEVTEAVIGLLGDD